MRQASPVSLSASIGKRLRELRDQLGWSQDRMAAEARDWGLDWNRSMLAKTERGQRRLGLEEFMVLCRMLRKPAPQWIRDEGRFELTPLTSATPDGIRQVLTGWGTDDDLDESDWDTPRRRASADNTPRWKATFKDLGRRVDQIWPEASLHDANTARKAMAWDAERKAARKLGIDPFELALLAQKLWGRSLSDERDRRVDLAPPEGRQAARGHVTRALISELGAESGQADAAQGK